LILEGAVFLSMGLELSAVVGDVGTDSASIGVAVGLAALALLLTILVRGAYVAPLLAGLRSRANRGERMKPWIAATQDRLDDPQAAEEAFEGFGRRRVPSAAGMDRFRSRLRRLLADIDYLMARPLGWREEPSSCGPGCAAP
jgi:CPA1 family monovalent cation:H+ antiporter